MQTGMAAVGISIGYGTPLTMVNTASKIKKGTVGDTPALKPTLMAAVPAILDRIRDGVRKQVCYPPLLLLLGCRGKGDAQCVPGRHALHQARVVVLTSVGTVLLL